MLRLVHDSSNGSCNITSFASFILHEYLTCAKNVDATQDAGTLIYVELDDFTLGGLVSDRTGQKEIFRAHGPKLPPLHPLLLAGSNDHRGSKGEYRQDTRRRT